MSDNWRQYARCLGADPEIFYPSSDEQADEARMIFGVGLYTVSFYGPSAVFTATPSDVAAAIRAFALSRLALQLYPVGADGVSEVA